MAAINNSINLTDRMSPVLKTVLKALDSTMKAMDQLDRATNKGMNSDAFRRAENDIQAAHNAVRSLNGDLDKTSSLMDNIKSAASKVGRFFSSNFKNIDRSWDTFTTGLNSALSIADRIVNKFSSIMESADNARSAVARIGLYNTSSVSDLAYYGAIYKTALGTRTSLEDTADLVNKLLISGVFSGSGNILSSINTAGIINKALIAGGATSEDNRRALRQLNQALSSGLLQGDELRSIRENTPYFAQVLAEGLGMVDDKFKGIGIGDLKELGAQGELTSDRVIRAILAMQGKIDEKFKQMPKTFSQGTEALVTTWKYFLHKLSLAEGPLNKLTNIVWNLVDYLNSDRGSKLLDDIGVALSIIVDMCDYSLTGIKNLISFIQDNVPVATGLFYGLAAAMTASAAASFIAWLKVTWPILLIATVVGLVAYYLMQLGYSASETAGIILGAILAVISVLWDAILLIVDLGAFIIAVFMSAIVVFGTFALLVVQAVAQVIYWVVHAVTTVIDLVISVFKTLGLLIAAGIDIGLQLAATKLYTFANTVLTVLNVIASGIDKIFGSNLSGILGTFSTKVTGVYEEFMDKHDPKDDISEIGDVWKNFGNRTKDRFANPDNNLYGQMEAVLNGGMNGVTDIFDMFGKVDSALQSVWWSPENAYKYGYDTGTSAMDWIQSHKPGSLESMTAEEIAKLLGGSGVNVAGGNLDSVGSIKNDVNINDEDIQLLRDMAARDYLLNLQQITPVAHISFGDVRETADVNKIMDVIEDMVEEQMATSLVSN